MPPEIGGKWGTEVFQWEQSVWKLGSRVSSDYSAMWKMKSEAKKKQKCNITQSYVKCT